MSKILYNVTVKIDRTAHKDWVNWMQKVHIPDVMHTGLFTQYKMTKILGDDDEQGFTYAIQYVAESIEKFNEYQVFHAASLQKAHADRYPNKYVAFRTLMEIVSEG